MELTRFVLFAGAIAAILFATNTRMVAAGEVEDESEFSYVVGSENGPKRWSLLHKEWSACNNGRMQSPIDLADEKVEVVHHLGRLKRTYQPSPAVMRNRGHDIMIKWTNGSGGLWLNGTEYVLKQLHWHSPSEHTLNGKSFKLELHVVHESVNGEIAVVAILYRDGRPDPFLAEMEKYIHTLVDAGGKEKAIGILDPMRVPGGSPRYYRYTGSLTTPPCTEGVLWTIIKKVGRVSKEQIRLLRHAVHDHMEDNARPTQPTNKRAVHYNRPRRFGC